MNCDGTVGNAFLNFLGMLENSFGTEYRVPRSRVFIDVEVWTLDALR